VRLTTAEERDALLANCRDEALHLEQRDLYAIHGEAERFAGFQATRQRDDDANAPDRSYWLDLVRRVAQAGTTVRRARIVSEPVTDYIRFEWAGSGANCAAGEDIRWLPRRLASTMALPGNDFWLFDGTTVVFTVFTGNGDVAERQLTTDAATIQLCRSAFDAVWAAAIPHSEYTPS
jgi:Family of unknown function (DUF6879)